MNIEKTVVVVGGGVGGMSFLKAFEKKKTGAKLILVEPREYAEVPFAVLRGLTDPGGFARKIRKPWTDLTSAKVVHAKAAKVTDDKVILEDGREIPFDYAVVATGSTTRGYPFIKGGAAESVIDRETQFREEGEKLVDASSVLIIGGGPIGVELAGEINAAWPAKKVTLVHGTDRLLPALPPGAGAKAWKVLTGRGVEVALNTQLQADGDGEQTSFTATDGRSFGTDLVIRAIGIRVDSAAVAAGMPDAVEETGHIRVAQDLRIAGHPSVFALGDVNDVPEIKLGATTRTQANTTAGNIQRLLADPGASLRAYKPAKPMGLITFGRKGGVAQLPFGRFDALVGMKQKDMFVSMYLGK